jgi:hypothetical protein
MEKDCLSPTFLDSKVFTMGYSKAGQALMPTGFLMRDASRHRPGGLALVSRPEEKSCADLDTLRRVKPTGDAPDLRR